MQRIRQLGLGLCLCTMLCLVTGCGGNPQVSEMTKKPWIPKTAHWPELDVFVDNPDFQVPSVRKLLRSMGGGGGELPAPTRLACSQLSNPKFQENLKKFDETPIPADYDSPERQDVKKKLLTVVRDLQAKCKKNADMKAMQETARPLAELLVKISEIPNQKAPD